MILSIVIPLYNTEKYIEDCILSIVDNNVDASLYEVIVVNDGSTDNSKAVVERLCEKYENIKLINLENQGVSAARMKGVSLAKGEFLWFIDSDDWIVNGSIEKILDSISNDREIDSLVIPFQAQEDESNNIRLITDFSQADCRTTGKDLLMRQKPTLIGPPHFIFKTALFDDMFIYFPTGIRHEDEYFSRVLQYKLKTVRLLKEPAYTYRQWNGSFMKSSSIQSSLDLVKIYTHLSHFAETAVTKEDIKWFRHDIVSLLMSAYTSHPEIIDNPDFKDFQKENGPFIRAEFRHWRDCFSMKDQFLGVLLLNLPRVFFKARHLVASLRNR